ncbi:hypothetical protein ACIQUQ_15705 [Streptomyces sp. NPDC101118]|uniref:hypothetical protein n=1 Tax=Streptomyces sp. NPDC101118 TaxID=3366109 RepID=UPI00380CF357
MATEPAKAEAPVAMVSRLDLRGQELQNLCQALTALPVGDPVTAPRPVLDDAQHGFLTSTIWLSSWLHEAWAVSFTFLLDQANRVGVGVEAAQVFQSDLQKLRTRFSHNLDPAVPRDREIQEDCYAWFRRACGSRVPSGADWTLCLETLLEAAVAYLGVAIGIARAIEQDVDAEALLEHWKTRLGRSGVLIDYRQHLERAAGDLGVKNLELREVRERHRPRWDRTLSVASARSDIETVTQRHMEHALLAETGRVLPVTASQVMAKLELKPGERVAAALRLGQVLYALNPDQDRTALLDAIVRHWSRMEPDD